MSMPGYTKLFNSILASTIWREDDKTRIVWITLLAMSDKNGVAEGSVPGLADLARVTIPECEASLVKLMSPDPYSRTTENEGMRIKKVDGGWAILNHAKYRAKMSSDERREYNRLKQQEFRSKNKSTRRQRKSITVNDNQSQSALSAHTDTEAKADTNTVRNKSRGSIEDLRAYAVSLGLPESDGEAMFNRWESNGWKTGDNPIKDWKAGLRTWKDNHWLPSQKQNGSSRQSTPVNPRVAGTANANMCQQYAGIGRIPPGTSPGNGSSGQH